MSYIGLQQAWTDPSTLADYPDAFWAIVNANGDLGGNFIQAEVAAYVDQTRRDEGATALYTRTITFTAEDFAAALDLPGLPMIFREVVVSSLYVLLLRHTEFADAALIEP